MSCRDMPPPAFGAAAAGGRPLRGDLGGLKSAIHTNMMVNRKTETDNGNLEVLQSKMQEAMVSQSSCQTKLTLAGNKNETPAKGPYKRLRVDATKAASPGVDAGNTGQHLRPCKKSKGLGKRGKSEDNQGVTELNRFQTPINLFEDECVFCHSFRTTEKFHGPMVRYREGRIVSSDEGNLTNAIYVHKKCMVWAPRVFFDGDKFVNMEKEISRSSRLKCSRCRLPGAALGCYYEPCAKTYHVPCAMMIPECFWDVKNLHVWCPKHASDPVPCDEMSSPILESDVPSPVIQNPCQAINCRMQDKQINPFVTPDSLLGQNLDTQRMHVIHRREDEQVDQPNNLSSFSLPRGQYSKKEGIFVDYRREEKQRNQSRTPVNQWILLGSVLSAPEKVSLKKFASLTTSTLAEEWDKNVTHVIVGRSAGNACGGSYEVLMGILSGKWVVRAGWIVDCLVGPIPSPETSYEVEFYNGVRTSIDGPRKGRAAAAEGAPKLFSGLYFCLSAYMNPERTRNIKYIIEAAEGQVLEGTNLSSLRDNLDKNALKVYFIYDGGPPSDHASTLILDEEIEEARKYLASGAQLISHLWLFDAILSYDARMLERGYGSTPMLERSYGSTPDMYVKTARKA